MKNTCIHFSKTILVCIIFLVNHATAQGINDSVFNAGIISNIQLQNVDANKKISLNDKQRLTLFVFLSPECPLCQSYSGLLNGLYKQYHNNINMYGIIPGKAYSVKTIKDFKQEYKILFPLLIDNSKKLSSYLQASVTPQVILLNKNCEMIYKGAIDNLLLQLGKRRIKATDDFLSNAIFKSLHNETISVKRTKAVGCRINDY